MNVLIVDDEANNRAFVTKMVEDFPIIKEIKLAGAAIENLSEDIFFKVHNSCYPNFIKTHSFNLFS